jgi:hypothetical protein
MWLASAAVRRPRKLMEFREVGSEPYCPFTVHSAASHSEAGDCIELCDIL